MATYYVDPVSGVDVSNDGLSFANAWATTQYAADTAVAGDVVRLCDTGTESAAATINFDTNAGDTTSGPIRFVAYSSDGTTPLAEAGGHYEIQASASITNLIAFTSSANELVFEGIDFDGNSNVSGDLVNHNGVSAGDKTTYRRCKFHGASGTGVIIRTPYLTLVNCDIYANGGAGVAAAAAISSRWTYGAVVGCRIHDNTGPGIGSLGGQQIKIVGNEIYDNGGDGMDASGGALGFDSIVYANTLYGNVGDGADLSANLGSGAVVENNTAAQNGGYGFKLGTSFRPHSMDRNHTYNNTSGPTDFDSGTMPGVDNQTGDPQFASVTDGSEDFTPADGSPLDGTGLNGVDIGARKAADPAGGGGGGGGRQGLHAIESGAV